MRTLLLLLLALACRPQTDIEALPAPIQAEALGVALSTELMNGRRAWTEGDRSGAAAIVRAAYRGPFSELEPALHAHDPQATLELEYAFGQLALRAEGKADPAVPAQFDALIARLKESLAALPRPELAPGQEAPPALEGGVTTVPSQ